MEEDPIMQELRQVRKQLLEEAGGDLGKLIERANREGPLLLARYRKSTQPAQNSTARPVSQSIKRAKRTAGTTSSKNTKQSTPFRTGENKAARKRR